VRSADCGAKCGDATRNIGDPRFGQALRPVPSQGFKTCAVW